MRIPHMTITQLLAAGAVALATLSHPERARHPEPGARTAGVEGSAVSEPFAQSPPAPRTLAGPADSLYRMGRDAINKNDFKRAASIFADISAKYPKSEYAADAPYWRAFALYKLGGEDDLRSALRSLETQEKLFPKAATVSDGKQLAVRIRGALAQQGDAAS